MKDTGPGISESDQKKVFEPFQQTDNSIRRKYGGSGLGLTISKQFVEMHGGHMWLESQLNKGTLIGFDLPLETRVEERPAIIKPTKDLSTQKIKLVTGSQPPL